MEVRKSDGTYEEYSCDKVKSGIYAAYRRVKEEYKEDIGNAICDSIVLTDKMSTEEIRSQVEPLLMNYSKKAASAYIKYGSTRGFVKDRVHYMDNYVNSADNAATSSETDPNANVTKKNVANLDGEVYKTQNRKTQRYKMTMQLKKVFPEVAKQYVKDLEDHIIYTHDEASSPSIKNYCEAVSLYPLLVDGTKNMDGLNTTPPKNLDSFCGQLINLTFMLAAQCKGAVAYGEFFNFIDYFCAKDFGENYTEILDEYADAEFMPHRKTVRERICQAFQSLAYNLNQPASNRSFNSPFTNISYYCSGYWHALFDDFYFPDGTQPKWERVDVLQKMFMRWFCDTRSKTLLTFPVETMALLTDGTDVIDKDYKDFTNEMWAKGHSFFVYLSDKPDSLASCCRVRNKIDKNVFSFTNGLTGVQTGSVNVITMNLSRIIQNYFRSIGDTRNCPAKREYDTPEFISYFTDIVERVVKYQFAYKDLVYDVEKKGMLTASTAGYIKMNKLFSTIGFGGMNEAAEFVGLTCNYNEDYKKFARFITKLIDDVERRNEQEDKKLNIEMPPLEGTSSKFYNWDKEDGYWVPEDRVLYNSYFYLADDPNTSVIEKLKLHGREFTEYLSGGVGCHINLDTHLSKEQYEQLMMLAIKFGTSYYTYNVPQTSCNTCGHIEKTHFDVCPHCGGTDTVDWTRVIGYLRPISAFDKYRQIEAKRRVYHKDVE